MDKYRDLLFEKETDVQDKDEDDITRESCDFLERWSAVEGGFSLIDVSRSHIIWPCIPVFYYLNHINV